MKFLFTFLIAFALSIIPVHHSEEAVIESSEVHKELVVSARGSYFDHVYEKLRYEEGNYVWDNLDFGKETYGGVTRQYNPKWEGWKEIDKAKVQANGKKVHKLQWNQKVEAVEPYVKDYYRDWWTQWNFDVIQDSLAAVYTFDFAICGTPSIKVIQSTLNDLGKKIKVNGKLSIREAEMINSIDPVVWVESLRINRKDFYWRISNKLHKVKDKSGKFMRDSTGHKAYLRPFQPIVVENGYVYGRTQKKFLPGWLIRADRIKPALKKRVNAKRNSKPDKSVIAL